MLSEPRFFPHGQENHISDEASVVSQPGHGRGKNENQDAYWPYNLDQSRQSVPDYLVAGRLYIVADGISMSTDGRRASHQAVDVIGKTFYELTAKKTLVWGGKDFEASLVACLRDSILKADQELVRQAQQASSSKTSLQTTCVCVLIHGSDVYLAHVGDSRAYLLRRGELELEQLTQDHTNASSNLTQALGIGLRNEEITISRYPQQLSADDLLLLCSDGLYKEVSEQQMAAVLSSRRSLSEQCNELLRFVQDNPGPDKDDVTILLIKFAPPTLAQKQNDFNRHILRDDTKQAIQVLEQMAWWSPHYLVEQNKNAQKKLAELYAVRGQQLLSTNLDLADRLNESARRLGGAPILAEMDSVRQFVEIKRQWPIIQNSREKSREAFDKLLPIARTAASDTGDEVWNLLLDMADVVVQGYSREWQTAGRYYLLMIESVDEPDRLDAKGQQKYSMLREKFQKLRTGWLLDIVERTKQLMREARWYENLEQLAETLIMAAIVWAGTGKAQVLGPNGHDRHANEERNEVNWARVNLLTAVRLGLLYQALLKLSEGKLEQVGELTRPYSHWPEAHALQVLANEFRAMGLSPAHKPMTEVSNKIDESIQRLRLLPICAQLYRRLDLQRPLRQLYSDFTPRVNNLNLSDWRRIFSQLHAGRAVMPRSTENFQHNYRALRWLEADDPIIDEETSWYEQMSNQQYKLYQRAHITDEAAQFWQLTSQLEREHARLTLTPLARVLQESECKEKSSFVADEQRTSSDYAHDQEGTVRVLRHTEPAAKLF